MGACCMAMGSGEVDSMARDSKEAGRLGQGSSVGDSELDDRGVG